MKLTGIPIKGTRIKDGKLVKFQKLDVSARIRQKKSKRVSVKRRTP
jgi:hypothetical protein